MSEITGLELLGQRREPLSVGANACQLALGDALSGAAILADCQPAEPGAHLAPVARGDEVALLGREPVAARRLLLAGDDLDDLAIDKHVTQRHDPSVC